MTLFLVMDLGVEPDWTFEEADSPEQAAKQAGFRGHAVVVAEVKIDGRPPEPKGPYEHQSLLVGAWASSAVPYQRKR